MADRGVLLQIPVPDNPLFMAINFLIGAWDGQVWKRGDREFAELVNAYLPDLSKAWSFVKTQQVRVVPVNSAVSSASAVKPYDQIRKLVTGKDLIALAKCTCAIDTVLLGGTCEYPDERCISFGGNAANLIAMNLAREINHEELSLLLDMGEENGLVLHVGNAKSTDFICMCCHCRCVLLKMLKFGGKPGDPVQSSFYAAIDPDACTACGTCPCQLAQAECRCMEAPMEACMFIGDPHASFVAEHNPRFRKIDRDEAVHILEDCRYRMLRS